MLYFLLSILGRFFAALPVFVVQGIARGAGWLLFRLGRGRVRVALSGLHHAFPERDEAWRRQIALESCRRMVEMGLFVLASPYFSVKRIRRMFQVHESLRAGVAKPDVEGVAEVILTPHFSMMESLTMFRAIYPEVRADVRVGVFYRPFANAGLERWVKTSRERFGTLLLSRRAGFGMASDLLRHNQRVAVLFDQHAATAGALSLFFGRLVSTTELPGLLAAKHRAGVLVFHTERTGFWRGTLRCDRLFPVPESGQPAATPAQVTIAANRWLEERLRSGDSQCADWLWLHRRWKVSEFAHRRFQIPPPPRDILAENLAALGLDTCPRRERFWVWLPQDLPGLLAAVPLVRALRASRMDAEVTLVSAPVFVPLLEGLGIAERILTPPPGGDSRENFFRRMRLEYPDTCVLLDNSPRAAHEARLTGAPQRFGLRSNGGGNRYLTHVWTPPAGTDVARMRRARLWEFWWKSAHGLAVDPDFSPVRLRGAASVRTAAQPIVGLAAEPAARRATDRWPDAHWQQLARNLAIGHGAVVRVFGNPCAWARFAPLIAELPAGALENHTRAADARGLAATTVSLAECRCVVGRPAGGLPNLANFLGIPVVLIPGASNPFPDAPCFSAPIVTLQPETPPPSGRVTAAMISPERAITACKVFL